MYNKTKEQIEAKKANDVTLKDKALELIDEALHKGTLNVQAKWCEDNDLEKISEDNHLDLVGEGEHKHLDVAKALKSCLRGVCRANCEKETYILWCFSHLFIVSENNLFVQGLGEPSYVHYMDTTNTIALTCNEDYGVTMLDVSNPTNENNIYNFD